MSYTTSNAAGWLKQGLRKVAGLVALTVAASALLAGPVTIRLDDVGAGTYQLVVKRPDTHARTTVVVLD